MSFSGLPVMQAGYWCCVGRCPQRETIYVRHLEETRPLANRLLKTGWRCDQGCWFCPFHNLNYIDQLLATFQEKLTLLPLD